MILDDIIKAKKDELEISKRYYPVESLKDKIKGLNPPRPFTEAVSVKGGPNAIRIIAEVKKASPSKGVIREYDFHPFEIARIYQNNGAVAISVITEQKFFMGHIDFLPPIKTYLKLPVLRKDFIFDEYQVYQTRSIDADAMLLIASILEKEQLKDLLALSTSLGMATLVEVHDEKELEAVLDTDARIIGVNNRDLKTFKTDLETTVRLAPYVPQDRVLVSESGINTVNDILKLMESGVNSFLIGEAIIREKDMAKKLRELRGLG